MMAVLLDLILILDVKTKRLLLRRFESDKVNKHLREHLVNLSRSRESVYLRGGMPTEIIFILA